MKIKIAAVLFFTALATRLGFYFIALNNLPATLQKFVTADTMFYYDPLALKMASGIPTQLSLLSVTRFTFLGYLSLFYRYLGHWYLPVSVFHCFLGALSVVFIFLATRIFLGEKTAFVAGLVASFQVVLVYWTPFVNTETGFLLLLSACIYLSVLFLKTKSPAYLFSLILFLVIMPLSRPLGIALSVFMLLYLQWLALKKIFKKNSLISFFLVNSAILTVITFCVLKFSGNIDKIIVQDYPQEFLQMSLYIDEMPQVEAGNGYLRFYGARLTIPGGMRIPKARVVPNPIKTTDVISYFKNHYDKYSSLMILRIYTLFNPWVPEYSLRHNIFNLFFYGAIYIFAITGLFIIRLKERIFANLLLVCIASQVFLIALTLVDYDFRYRLPIELILTIPVGAAISNLLRTKKTGNLL